MDDKKQELAVAYALGQLDRAATGAVETQAKQDPELRGAIRDLTDVIAASVRSLPQSAVPESSLSDIERALNDVPNDSIRVPDRSQPVRWAILGGLAALLIAGVSIGGYEWLTRREQPTVFLAELGAGRTQVRPLALGIPAQSSDGRFMQLASLAERLWARPNSSDARSGSYAVFDPATNQGFIAVREVPELQPKQRYHLWFIDGETGQVRDAGALPLDRATRGMFFFSLPPEKSGKSTRPSFFVTVEEDAEKQPNGSPRGRVVLGKRI